MNLMLPRSALEEIQREEPLRASVRAYIEMLGRQLRVFPIYIDLLRDYCTKALGEDVELLAIKQQLHVLLIIIPIMAEYPEPVDGYPRLFYLIDREHRGEMIDELEFLNRLKLPYIGQHIGDWSDLVELIPPARRRKPATTGPMYPVDLCSDEYWDEMIYRQRLEAIDNVLIGKRKRKTSRKKSG